jgi:ankyrin repeat protein
MSNEALSTVVGPMYDKRMTARFTIEKVLEQFSLEDRASYLNGVNNDMFEALSQDDTSSTDEFIQTTSNTTQIGDKLIQLCVRELVQRNDEDSDQIDAEYLRDILLNTSNMKSLDTIRYGKSDCTLMHLCAQRNKVSCMEVLVEFGASVDSHDCISATPLFYSCAHNCADTTTFLLHHGANVNHKDVYHNFPLLISLKNRFFAITEILMLFHANAQLRHGTRGSCLHYVTEQGNMDAVKYLLEQCGLSPFRLNDEEENLLFAALRHSRIVKYLIERFSSKKLVMQRNARKRNVFHECCYHGYFDSLLTILATCLTNNEEMTDALLSEILNEPDINGRTPLMIAVNQSRLKMIRFLCLCRAIDIDGRDSDGNTALHHAIMKKDNDAVAILVSIGGSSRKLKNKSKVSCNQLAKEVGITLGNSSVPEEEEDGELSFADLMKEDIVLEHFENSKQTDQSTNKTSEPVHTNGTLSTKTNGGKKSPRSTSPVNPLLEPTTDGKERAEPLSFEQLMREESRLYEQMLKEEEEQAAAQSQKKNTFGLKKITRLLSGSKPKSGTGKDTIKSN